jgi:type II secretory pathway pseudopilin PulG
MLMPPKQRAPDRTADQRPASRRRLGAFTLVELLVVLGIIALLIALVVAGGAHLAQRSKVRDTEALLSSLNQALDAFAADKPFARVPAATGLNPNAQVPSARYGDYPPDELMAFDCQLPGTGPPGYVLLVTPVGGNYPRVTVPTLPSGKPQPDVNSQRAMVLAIRLRSPSAAAILDRVPDRFRAQLAAGGEVYQADASDAVGTPLVYYVDAWGQPIEYYSTRVAGSSSPARDKLSAMLVSLNNSRPVLMSYGPNGADQLSGDYGNQTLLADFSADGKIDENLNQDNVYSSDSLRERVARGAP